MDPSREGATSVTDLLRGIVDDLKTIARDEAALARLEVSRSMKRTAADTAAIVLAGIVALIGFGMLCVSAVIALEPVIASLTVRLLLMAAVYLVLGGVVAAAFAKKLKRDVAPDMSTVRYEARSTVANMKAAVRHA